MLRMIWFLEHKFRDNAAIRLFNPELSLHINQADINYIHTNVDKNKIPKENSHSISMADLFRNRNFMEIRDSNDISQFDVGYETTSSLSVFKNV